MASNIPANAVAVAGPNLLEMNSSFMEKAVFSAGINSRTSQDIPFPFTSPNVGDVPIDTSIFTSDLPTASFNELLQQYEDPAVSISDTLPQTPQKAPINLTMLTLDGVETNVVTTIVDTCANINTKPLSGYCTCIITEEKRGEVCEIPVDQVFLRDGQMYFLPDAGLITLANIEFNAFLKNNQWYLSLQLLFYAVGPEVKKHLGKAIEGLGAANLDLLTLDENHIELLSHKTGLTNWVMREAISISCLQAICKSISQTVEDGAIRNIAYGDVYRRLPGNSVLCSNCGLLIKKNPVQEKYEEVICSQSMSDNVVPSNVVPNVTIGMVSASNAKFCAFQMKDTTYINLAEVVRFKMFTWTAIQRKLNTLGKLPINAPAGVEERFDSGANLGKGQWIDLINLRCCCCMGNGRCTIKGHSEEVWQALKLGQWTYEVGLLLFAMDETLDAVGSIPVCEPESNIASPSSTVPFINLESTVNDRNDGCFSNGNEEHVSSTTDGFVPGTAQISLNEDQIEQRPETVNHDENATKKQCEGATINSSDVPVSLTNERTVNELANNATEYQLTEPNGEMVVISFEEVKATEEVDSEEISRQFGFTMDKNELENNNTYSENVENVREEEVVEVMDHTTVSKEMEDCNNSKTDIVVNSQEEFQNYFIGRPRGRPTKCQEAFAFKPPVEKSVKRGTMYLFPGDIIVPDIEELNQQIENKKVVIGQKNLISEVMSEKSIANSIQLQKASTTKMSFSGRKAMKQERKFSEPQTRCETTNSDREKDITPVSSKNNDEDKVQTISVHTSDVINIHPQYKTEQPDLSSSQNEKVVIEYVQSRVEPDEQKLIAHEKEVEKAEICFMPSRSNSNTPEKAQLTNRSKIPEQSMVARNIWPDNQAETYGASKFTSPLVDSSSSNQLIPGISESFGSPVPGIFTPSQVSSTPKTPPAWSVERLAKITSSKSFSGPEAVLLTLATLAADESGSDQEQAQTDAHTKKPDVTRPVGEETAITSKTIEQITSEKDQIGGHENKITEKDNELNMSKSRGSENSDTGPKGDCEEPLEESLLTNKEKKLEMISRLKKCAIFTCDKGSCEWKVKRFTKQAKVEFPELFDGSDSEEMRTQFAFVLSSVVTNNFRKFLQERRGRSHKNVEEKSKEKVDSGVSDLLNNVKSSNDGLESVSSTEILIDQSKANTMSSYSHNVQSVQNTSRNLTHDLELEVAVKSITTVNDESMNKRDKKDSVSANPSKDIIHENMKPKRGRPRKQKQDVIKGSNSTDPRDNKKRENQVKDAAIKPKEAENDKSDLKMKEKHDPSASIQVHEPLVVRIVGAKWKKQKSTGKPEKRMKQVSNENVQSLKLSDKKKGIGKKRKRVNSTDLETKATIDTACSKAEVEVQDDNKEFKRIKSRDTNDSEGIEKLVIRTDKSGIHVMKSTDKPKRKQKHTAETCSNDQKRKKSSLTHYADDDFLKTSESIVNLQKNDLGKIHYDNVTQSQNSLPKKEMNDCKVKPLKIKLSVCKKLKQQKGKLTKNDNVDEGLKVVKKTPNEYKTLSTDSNKIQMRLPDFNSNGKLNSNPVVDLNKIDKNSVILSDEEMDDFSHNAVLKTAESESEETISEEKIKFFQAVSLVSPVTELASHPNERLSRSPVKAVKNTRLSRSSSVSPSKSPVKVSKDISQRQLPKSPDSKKKKLCKSDDNASKKTSKSPKRKSSEQITSKNDLENEQLLESNRVNINTGTTSRKHSKSPERLKTKEKRISADNDLRLEQLAERNSLNQSTDKINRKDSKSPGGRTCTLEENQMRTSSKSERKTSRSPIRRTEKNMSKSPQKCSSRKGRKPQTDNKIATQNLSKSPDRHHSSKHKSPKRSPKKS